MIIRYVKATKVYIETQLIIFALLTSQTKLCKDIVSAQIYYNSKKIIHENLPKIKELQTT